MYITKIELFGVRCYEELVLDLEEDKDNVKWVTILGDNGTGKSTLLKSIAIGLCDETSAAGLLREVPWQFRNKNTNPESAIIKIHIFLDKNIFEIQTKIKPLSSSENSIERIERTITNKTLNKEIDDYDFPWDKLFICGYGASRSAEGTTDYLNYSIIDAVYTLFRYDQPLQNPELAMRRLAQKREEKHKINRKETLEWLNKLLNPILQLKDDEKIDLDDDGVWVKSVKWGKTPIGATGDGYKATLTWIMDLISWASYFNDNEPIDKDIQGIVLIDEIEQHLHPRWQRDIVGLLRNTFINIQFISTTHSPLVTLNTNKIDDEYKSKIYFLKWIDVGKVNISEVQEQIIDISFDQILGSEAFGHIYEMNNDVNTLLKVMSELASKDELIPSEQELLDSLKYKLKDVMFPEGRTLIERIVEREYYSELAKRSQEFNDLIEKHRDS